MILVKTYYNTDAEGNPVPDSVAMEDLPITYHGPFEDLTQAISWMENDYPENDTDVYDQIAGDFPISEDADYINSPDSIFGDFPDEDIRDDSQEIHGP